MSCQWPGPAKGWSDEPYCPQWSMMLPRLSQLHWICTGHSTRVSNTQADQATTRLDSEAGGAVALAYVMPVAPAVASVLDEGGERLLGLVAAVDVRRPGAAVPATTEESEPDRSVGGCGAD